MVMTFLMHLVRTFLALGQVILGGRPHGVLFTIFLFLTHLCLVSVLISEIILFVWLFIYRFRALITFAYFLRYIFEQTL